MSEEETNPKLSKLKADAARAFSDERGPEQTKQLIEEQPKARGYRRRTDAELEQLAQDVIAGRVFTSMQVERPEDVSLVFMMLVFLGKDDIDWMKSVGISLFYEYMDKASPRSINGYPCFLSMQYLDGEDHVRLGKRYDEIKNFLAARKAGDSKP